MRPESHHKRQPAARAFGAKNAGRLTGKKRCGGVCVSIRKPARPTAPQPKNDEKGSLALPFKVVKTHLQKN